MSIESRIYLTRKQAIEKYGFLTENMLKNLLFKNVNGFRDQVVKKVGHRVLLDDTAMQLFLQNCKSE